MPPVQTVPGVQYIEDFFVYDIDFTTAIAPASTATGNINIQADSDFKWIKAAYYATIANAAFTLNAIPIPSVTIQITDSGSGRALLSSPTPLPNIFGRGELPFILPLQRIFKARSNIAITLANFDAAVSYQIRLAFIGTKIFKLG